jgi:hypothetical protein
MFKLAMILLNQITYRLLNRFNKKFSVLVGFVHRSTWLVSNLNGFYRYRHLVYPKANHHPFGHIWRHIISLNIFCFFSWHYSLWWALTSSSSFKNFYTEYFLWDGVVSTMPNPLTGRPGYPFFLGRYLRHLKTWETLPVATLPPAWLAASFDHSSLSPNLRIHTTLLLFT